MGPHDFSVFCSSMHYKTGLYPKVWCKEHYKYEPKHSKGRAISQDLIHHFAWRQLANKGESKSPVAQETSPTMCNTLVNTVPIKGPAPLAIGMTQNLWDLHLKGEYSIPIIWFSVFTLARSIL